MTTIGVDLGGTKVLAAAVAADGTTSDHAKLRTPQEGPAAVVAAVVEAIRRVDPSPSAVGVGVPGPVRGGVMLEAPNLAGFDQPVPFGDMLADALGRRVVVGNDANVGTLGEVRSGAARDASDVLGCWLGTGVGGGLVLDGALRTGPHGTGGELGHVPVQLEEPRRCGCGRLGCLEAYAGRASMAERVQEAIDAGEETALATIKQEKGKDRLTSGVWRKALEAGDPVATRLMDTAVAALGAALAGVVNMVDVEVVVFGGGLADKLGQAHVDRIAAAAAPHLMAPQVARRWVLAELGDDAGVVGAAALARG